MGEGPGGLWHAEIFAVPGISNNSHILGKKYENEPKHFACSISQVRSTMVLSNIEVSNHDGAEVWI